MEKEVIRKTKVMWVAVPTGATLAVIDFFAVANNWYRTHQWIDTFIHFGWAVALGLIVYWMIVRHAGPIDMTLGKSFPFTVLVALSLTALGGVLWEFGEFTYDFINNLYGTGSLPVQLSLQDTMGDLFFDLLGGLGVAIFAWLRYHKKRK